MPNEERSWGPVIGSIVIIAIIIIGGLYVWSSRLTDDGAKTSDAQTEALGQVSNSDEPEAIVDDLNAVDFNTLDQGLETVNPEL